MKYKLLINYLLFKHREGSWNITVQVLREGLESELSINLSRWFSHFSHSALSWWMMPRTAW